MFVQGSYRNHTNVRQESDVDIGILCSDVIFLDLPEGYTREHFGLVPATYTYAQFKNEVEEALVSHFGRRSVVRGNKAFDIRENTYRVDADVIACFEHRRYSASGSYESGVELITDRGNRVINWPEQHYQNGVDKNTQTARGYKRLVRILKRLCLEMEEQGLAAARPMPGFLVECLSWNVPNDHFGHDRYRGDVRAALAFLFNNTLTEDKCSEWGEVSELKYLFRLGQRWTWQQAHDFTNAAWDYIGLE